MEGPQSSHMECPMWCAVCRCGKARIRQLCRGAWLALRAPAGLLRLSLPQGFTCHQVPKGYREDGIISGYRHPRSSALHCVLSCFHLNNETANIWTHFIATWYFVWRFALLCCWVDFLSEDTWPLLVYMLLICLYPLISSAAHAFSTMSPETRHICFFFDYGAISLYSLGCAITYGAYVMPERWLGGWLHRHFVSVAVANTVFCTGLSCYSRFTEIEAPHRSKVLRTAAFVYPFLFDNIPLFYRLLLCTGEGCNHSEAVPTHYCHLTFAFLTCFLFTSHLPERLSPGRFDYFGHSHQLFHICASLGTHFQLEALLMDMQSRSAWMLSSGSVPSLLGTVGALVLGLVLNLGLIAVFSTRLLRSGPAQLKLH